MPDIIAVIKSNPIALVACIIVAVMVFVSIVKRIISLLFIAIFIVAAYAGYLVYTGQDVPTSSDEIIEHGRKKFEDVKNSIINGQGEQILNQIQNK